MTDDFWQAWSGQPPPPGFAERTTAHVFERERSLARMQRRRAVWITAAAVLLGTASAWAMRELGHRAPPRPAGIAAPAPAERDPIRESPSAVVAPIAIPAAEPVPSVESAAPRRKPSARPATSAAPPPIIHVPRCECVPNEGLCTCL
jgi:hypothetical protein